MDDKTAPKQLEPFAFKPGESGNPAGRPKGARSKLGEEFVQDLLADWKEHGAKVIIDVREDKPDQYLKVVASILPKELNVKVSELDELTDDQLTSQLAFIAAQLARAGVVAGDGEASEATAHSLN
jgi:hypothetical protein